MIVVKKATPEHVEGISRVCTEAFWATYQGIYSREHIERVNREFYNHKRILSEVTETTREWNGYYVALDDDTVVGAIGGGMIDEHVSEVFVLYLDLKRRREGIGTLLLDALTEVQQEKGANEQWVSVAKGNQKGIPFYEAKGFVKQSERSSYGNTSDENYISIRYCRKI